MPDRPELQINNQLAAGNVDSVSAKFQREAELLRDGLGTGIVNRAVEMWENPSDTAVNLGACAGAGLALNLASRAGGRWAAGARIATGVMTLGLGVDVVRRGVPTVGAMADTWSSASHLDASKETVAKFAGSALVDYPVMMLAGYGGYRAGGAIPMRTTQFHYTELSPNHLKAEPMSPSTKALLDSGIPISAETRGLMNNPSISGMRPGDRAAAVKALMEGGTAPKLETSGLPVNATTRGLMENPSISGMKPGDRAAAVKAIMEGNSGPGGFGGAKVSDFNIPKGLDIINPAKFDANLMMTRTFSVTRPTLIPTVVPFDLIQRSETQLIQGKAAGGLVEGAMGAAAGGIMQRLHQMNKVEEAPMPREIKQLEIPALKLEHRNNAIIQEQRHHNDKRMMMEMIHEIAKPKEK